MYFPLEFGYQKVQVVVYQEVLAQRVLFTLSFYEDLILLKYYQNFVEIDRHLLFIENYVVNLKAILLLKRFRRVLFLFP